MSVYATADFNRDGAVNAADYTVWRDALGAADVAPYSGGDASGDGAVGPEDYTLWSEQFGAAADELKIREVEAGAFVAEVERLVDLDASGGDRLLTFDVSSQFPRGDGGELQSVWFQVYLLDPADRSSTLLDRGQSGESIFSLQAGGADYPTGKVTFDGSTVSVDLSSIEDRETGLLVFQLVNGVAANETTIDVRNLASVVDASAGNNLGMASAPGRVAPGDAVDLDGYGVLDAGIVRASLSNTRYQSETGLFQTDVGLRNNGPPLSKGLVLRVNNLPAGVTVANSSGVDSTGAPYLNFAPAIGSGGLDRGQTTARVGLVIDNPSLQLFQLDVDVLSLGPNRAPVFPSIADQTAVPGDVVTLDLAAVDPDGDEVVYSLAPIQGGPNVALAGGQLVLSPTPSQVGSYQISVTASDGVDETTRTFLFSVAPDASTSTRISGRVLDVDGTPIAGVPISISRVTAFTGADGAFVLELPPHLLPTTRFDIHVPQGDAYFDPFGTGDETIEFRRAQYDTTTGTGVANPRRHPNLVSSFLDGSVVYGSDEERADALRASDGTGKLKTSPGDLLPLNSSEYFPDGPLENDSAGSPDPTSLFVAGDVRASENPALSSLHTILLREHNRLAEAIGAAEPGLSGEAIYQRARRMVIAQLQHITYSEYLPLLLGAGALTPYAGYDPAADPTTGALFTTAAFRFGHSQALPDTARLADDGSPLPAISAQEGFFNTDPIVSNGIEAILRGIASQVAEEVDAQIIDELRNALFGPPGSGGVDLAAMSIQRGRDLGLPSYNQARVDFGLTPVGSFAEITSDATVQQALATTYGSVDDVDVFAGGMAEDHAPGAMVGELFARVIADQFQRSRDGDRFWYENEQFTEGELAEIRGTTLSALILRNTDITHLPGDVFTTLFQPAGPVPAGAAASTIPGESRSIDGSGNNPDSPTLGATGQNLRVDASLNYADGVSAPAGAGRPSARTVSNNVFDHTATTPSASGSTAMFVAWGQLMSHDLSLTPTGVSDTLRIQGDDTQIEGKAYPFVAEKIGLMLGHSVYEGVNNTIARPIYLPAIDLAGGTQVDPSADTMVMQEIAPGQMASVEVAAGTLIDQQGQPFNEVLSITSVPPSLTPASLPRNISTATVVTIQPAEMVFTQPAPLSLPNTGGFPAGMTMDLWSIDPETGEFEIVGQGRVSGDGTLVNTISGGVRTTSWSFAAPPPAPEPEPPGDSDDDPDDGCPCKSDGEPVASEVRLHSGEYVENHDLVTYESLGVTRGLTLTYKSLRADPRPIVHFGFDNPDLPWMFASLEMFGDNFRQKVPGYVSDAIFPGEDLTPRNHHFWQTNSQNADAAIQADLSNRASGLYDYRLDYGLGVYLGEHRFSGTTRPYEGQVISINSIDSPFGAGWGLNGLEQIIENADGSVLLVDGSRQLLFDAPTEPGGPYASPAGDFSVLEKLEDGTFRRTSTEQTVTSFGANRFIASMVDRNGNATAYQYDAEDRLTKVVDPVGLETVLSYAGGKLESVTDPAGRVTRFQHDADGNLTRIIDPDLSERTFEYDSRRHLTSETNQRGARDEVVYGYHGRVERVILPDGSERLFEPAQVQSLHPPEVTKRPSTAPDAVSRDAATASYTDANGNVITATLTKAQQIIAERDSIGGRSVVQRNSDNLISSVTDARGNVTNSRYDDRGNLTETWDSVVQVNRWDGPSSGSWENPANWSTGAVPNPEDNVVIDQEVTVTLSGNMEVKTLLIGENATLRVTGSFLVGTISNRGRIEILGVTTLDGDFTNGPGGTLVVSAAGGDSGVLFISDPTRFENQGLIRLVNLTSTSRSVTLRALEGTLVNGPQGVIEFAAGTSTTGFGLTRVIDAPFINQGTLRVVDAITSINQGFTNEGVVENLGPALRLSGATVNRGTIAGDVSVAGSNDSIRNDGEITGAFLVTDNATYLPGTGTDIPQITDATIGSGVNVGEIHVLGTATLDGGFTNGPGGTLVVSAAGGSSGFLTVSDPTQFENQGLIRLVNLTSTSRAVTLRVGEGTLVNGPQGVIEFAAGTSTTGFGLTRVIDAPFINQGTVRVVDATTTINQDFSNEGTVEIARLQTLTASAGFTQTASGQTLFEVAGAGGSQTGRLAVTDTASLDGELSLFIVDSFAESDSVSPLNYSSRAGEFATVSATNLDPSLVLTPTYGATELSLVAGAAAAAGSVATGSQSNPFDAYRADSYEATAEPASATGTTAVVSASTATALAEHSPAKDPGYTITPASHTDETDATAAESDDGPQLPAAIHATSEPLAAPITRYTYDDTFSQLTSMTDPLGHTTLYEVDPANGNRLSMTEVVGLPDAESGETDDLVTSFTYTASGQVDTVTDPLGRVTDFDYDPYGRLVMATFAVDTVDEAVQRIEYANFSGDITATVDANLNRTEFQYDAMGRLTRLTEPDPDGEGPLTSPVTEYDYDASGNLLSVTDAEGSVTAFGYDLRDRVTRATDAQNNTTFLRYDKVGNLTVVTDPLQAVTRNVYDLRNRLVETIDPDGGSTTLEYDADDNLVALTDPVGNRTEFAYDARDRVTGETDPLGQTIGYEYDLADNLSKLTDRNGRVTSFVYDDLDRLVGETWLDAAGLAVNQIDYAYDAVGNLLSIGDSYSQLAYAYDHLDRPLSEDNAGTPAAPRVALEYRYDDVGNVLSISDAIDGQAGAVTTYQYDALDRTTRVTQTGADASDKRVDLAYNQLGQYASIERYSDLAGAQPVVGTQYAYDSLNRLVDLRHSSGVGDVAFYEFAYDADSRITSINDIDGLTAYTHDARDQLIGADRAASDARGDESYSYDANGNRVASHRHGAAYETGPANRLVSDGVYDYEYDNEGNTIRRTEIATGDYRELQWDHRNRLVAVSDHSADGTPTQRVTFTYDTLNRRIAKAVDATPEDAVDAAVVHFVYDREDVILDFVDSDGAGPAEPLLAKRYLHGPAIDQVFAQDDGAGQVEWLLTDHLGTTRDLVNSSGVVVNHLKYDSFGAVIEESNEAIGTRYQYTGRESDEEIALMYYRARYYDAVTGRFASEDPLGFGGGDTNLFRYVANDVLRFVDPFGECGQAGQGGSSGGSSGSGSGSSGSGSGSSGSGSGSSGSGDGSSGSGGNEGGGSADPPPRRGSGDGYDAEDEEEESIDWPASVHGSF
ncbi:peroxidase family protein [Botrimarina sp.]|uniref:peroxidase family protein n=1 Tax=Botrimarina sp. TaxID=2795802 RepID=UPI0032EB20DB